jgi:galactokinase
VELLGNHTDHNGGLVLSAAIDRTTCVAAVSNKTDRVRVWSENMRSGDDFTIPHIDPLSRGSWPNYVRAAVAGLIEAGVAVGGLDAAIVSDVPLGGGLSSSASLECAMAMAVVGLFGESCSRCPAGMELAELLQRFEHRMVGVACGILDQFSSIFGRYGHALFLNCDTLDNDSTPLGTNPPAIVVCDSGVARQLATGKYNERRNECDAALESIRQLCGGGRAYHSLSDLLLPEFLECQDKLNPVLARRVRHVLTENDRVLRGFQLLQQSGDIYGFAQLMFHSHQSSREDFENSSNELDALVEIASHLPGCLGAKLSGAGWGGCTVNLVEPDHTAAFARSLLQEYSQRSGIQPKVMICHAADGARAIRL